MILNLTNTEARFLCTLLAHMDGMIDTAYSIYGKLNDRVDPIPESELPDGLYNQLISVKIHQIEDLVK